YDQLDKTEQQLTVKVTEINNRLGTSITPTELAEIFEKLFFPYQQEAERFHITVPTRRQDIKIFEDVLEEVARIYGYDHLPYTLPIGSQHAGKLTKKQLLKRYVKQYFESAGLMEAITYSLTTSKRAEMLVSPEIEKIVRTPVR